jgi:hypothetical protein
MNTPTKSPAPIAWRRQESGIWVYYETKAWDDLEPLYAHPSATVREVTETDVGLACDQIFVQVADPLQRAGVRAALESFAASRPVAEPSLGKASLAEFNELMGDTKESPIERLRFFCSLAMSSQDWLDVEPFLDALTPLVAAPQAAVDAAELDLPTVHVVIKNGKSQCIATLEENAKYHAGQIKGSTIVPCRLVPISPPPEGGIGEPS